MPMFILESNDRIVKSRNEGIEFQLWDIVFGQTILAACNDKRRTLLAELLLTLFGKSHYS